MKGIELHTTPLFLGAIRLLPAGLALVAWAAADGRPQPATPLAWAWVLAFAVVDGAAFQGFLAEGLSKTSAGGPRVPLPWWTGRATCRCCRPRP
jgi:drug/metabolite transporter (DMT)-like permease